jgi:hypothetical protein
MKTAILLSSLSLCAVTGCQGNDQSLVIDDFVAISPMNMCVVTPGETQLVAEGQFDTAIYTSYATGADGKPNQMGYAAAPVIRNALANRIPQTSTAVTQRDTISVQSFDVQLRAGPGSPALPVNPATFSVKVAPESIPPGMGTAAFIVEVIPGLQAQQLNSANYSGTVIAHMRAVGDRAEGTITSEYVDFPIIVCQNCLGYTNAPCPTGGYKSSQVNKGGCIHWQDDFSTCCCAVPLQMDANNVAFCPVGGALCGVDAPVSM